MSDTKKYKPPSRGRCTAQQALQFAQDNREAATLLSGAERDHALGEVKIWTDYAASLEIK